jgi:type IV pilus assembly protein PilV
MLKPEMTMRRMRTRTRGLTLIEVLASTTIFSFGLLGLLGMHARAMSTFSDSKYRTDAAMLAESLIGEMWVNRPNLANYASTVTTPGPAALTWVNEVRQALPNGQAAITVQGNQVQVTVLWQPPAAAARGQVHTHTETATVQSP